jgi:hypothetical protein
LPNLLPEKPRSGWLERLVEAVGRAAEAGNAQTARLIALLLCVAGAASLVILASR